MAPNPSEVRGRVTPTTGSSNQAQQPEFPFTRPSTCSDGPHSHVTPCPDLPGIHLIDCPFSPHSRLRNDDPVRIPTPSGNTCIPGPHYHQTPCHIPGRHYMACPFSFMEGYQQSKDEFLAEQLPFPDFGNPLAKHSRRNIPDNSRGRPTTSPTTPHYQAWSTATDPENEYTPPVSRTVSSEYAKQFKPL